MVRENLNPIDHAIMDYLERDNEWRTIREIAQGALSRPKPTAYHRLILHLMVERGLLEAEQRMEGFRPYYVYRVRKEQ